MREEERPAGSHANIQLDSKICVAVPVMVAVFRARPSCTVFLGALRLAGPAGIIHFRGTPWVGEAMAQKIGDHHFIEADQR